MRWDPARVGVAVGIWGGLSLAWWQGQPALFDWDELIYGSLARHMVLSGDWLDLAINSEPFWEKPPLFFWLQAAAMVGLGINEAAARLPSALAGGILLGLMAWLGARRRGIRFGLLWAALLGTSLLPLWFGKTGLIDPLFNLGMLVGLVGLWWWEQEGSRRALLLAALALGLAMLAKGPLGLGLPILIAILDRLGRRTRWPNPVDLALFIAISLVVALSWVGLEWIRQGPTFLVEFVRYQWRILTTADGGRGGPIYFHLLAYGLGCFPFAALTLAGLRDRADPSFNRLMRIGFGTVLLLFSLVVQTKLVHYTSLLYPLGAYFAATRLEELWQKGERGHWLEQAGILLSGGVWILFLGLVPWLGQHRQWALSWVSDPLTRGYLMAAVEWPARTYLPAAILLVGMGAWLASRRRGWILLLLATWLSAQLSWAMVGARLLQHSQAVALWQRFQRSEQRVAIYGLRSFVPYFYGPSQHIPTTWALWQVIPLVENAQVDFIITWQIFEAELRARLDLDPIERDGAYVLLGRPGISLRTNSPPPAQQQPGPGPDPLAAP